MFEELFSRLLHGSIDLSLQLELKLIELHFNLIGIPTVLINVSDALLEIDAGFDGAKNLIADTEHTGKKLKFFRQQLEYTLIGSVLAVDEIDHHNVMLLAISMAAPDSLLNSLRVPGQVIVNQQGTELQVDAFGGGLGGNHDSGILTKCIHKGRTRLRMG